MRAVMADNAAEEMAGDMKSFNGSQLDFHDRPYNHILDHNPALKYFFVVCLALQTTFGTLGNILVRERACNRQNNACILMVRMVYGIHQRTPFWVPEATKLTFVSSCRRLLFNDTRKRFPIIVS